MQSPIEISERKMKYRARVSLLTIIVFVLAYLLMIAIAFGLAFGAIVFLFTAITKFPSPISIDIAAFLVLSSGMVAFFMIKFLVVKTETDISDLVEITEQDHPKLFGTIQQITTQLNIAPPKHVYLSASTNASVFYASSFRSLLFKEPKNLQLGLALVNSLTAEELKAVIAHEFGHFSQAQTRTGSYVYYVNQVIHSLASDASFEEKMEKMSASVPFINNLGGLAIRMMRGAQWVVVQLYKMVNVSYMALSREMEFHADAVAASCASGRALASALLRIELAETAFNEIIGFYNAHYKDGITTHNVYPQHTWVLTRRALEYELPMQNNLPVLSLETIARIDRSSVVISDQWASHPSTEERVTRLLALPGDGTGNPASAWHYFSDSEKVQALITAPIFNVQREDNVQSNPIDYDTFARMFLEDEAKHTFDKRYGRIYDTRNIERFDPATLESAAPVQQIDELFNETATDLIYAYNGFSRDMDLLELVMNKQIKVRTFDYGGNKYRRKEAEAVHALIGEQKEAVVRELNAIDQKAFQYFQNKETAGGKLVDLYLDYFEMQDVTREHIAYFPSFLELTEFLNFRVSYDDARHHCSTLNNGEKEFKKRLWFLFYDRKGADFLPNEIADKVKEYLSGRQTYFFQNAYVSASIDLLRAAIEAFGFLVNRTLYQSKKTLLDYQVELLGK